jgi:hypothetical protein
MKMEGVTEYSEGMKVGLIKNKNRYVIQAFNEGGFNDTQVDLFQLLNWLKKNRPDLIDMIF